MKPNLSEFAIISVLLIIVLVVATAGSKLLTTTAQGLLERALQVTEPRR